MNRLTRYIFASGLWMWCLMLFLPGTARAQSTIGFSIEGATVVEKDTFVIAVKADSLLTGKSIYSFRFGVSYNADYIEFLTIDSVGSVLKDWGIPTFNKNIRGQVHVAGAGNSVLSGIGNMIYLKFKALRPGSWLYMGDISGKSYLNEGTPKMTLNGNYIHISSRPYPDIYNDSYELFVGQEAQMYVSGGTSPYVFSIVDTAVAVISNQTMVKAKGPGITKAFVTDKAGEKSYTSGNIDVRAIKMSIMRSSAWPGDTFYLPVKIEIAPGTKVYSGYFEITYNTNVQGIKQKVNTGDFDISIESNSVTNLTRVSFASKSGITGSGILCYLGFKAVNSGNHYFYFQNLKFDEKLLAFSYSEYVEVYYLPSLNISPNNGTMMWGTTEKITVTNGDPPMSYKISNPMIATIDLLGNLTGLSGGKVKVSATDSHGATKTSDDFTILDNSFSIINSDGVLDNVTRVPVSTSALPAGKSLFDFDGVISFNESELEYAGVESVNGAMLTDFSKNGNSVHIVGATSSGIQSGIICYLKFKLKNTVALGQQVTVTLNSMTGNESSLYSTVSSGKITRVEQLSYRPVANAGLNKSIPEGEPVQLDGSGSYDEDNSPAPITYKWVAPVGITLDNNAITKPSFTAPNVNVNTVYKFKLVVYDGESDSDTATVAITVLQINKRPVSNAGTDKSVFEGSSVSLNGSLSSDPDLDVIAYRWTSLDGIILFDANSATPSFIAPQVNFDKSYRFKLEVTDGVLFSIPDTIVTTVIQVNKKPMAFAGGDQTVNEEVFVQLDGSLSSDPDNELITFKWIAPPVVKLSSYTISKPTFTAPLVHRDSVIIIALVVNDGKLNSDTDKVSITVKNLNILSEEAKILSADVLNADSVIVDSTHMQVIMYMPYGTDSRSLAPTCTISKLATISPANGSTRNFTSPVNYTVTAEDGITKKVYSLKVNIPTVTLKRNLAAGWNWISLSAVPADLNVAPVLANLTMTNLDYIKSATASAVYYTASGWFGDLTNLPQYEMLMFKKATSQNWILTGKEINPSLVTIPVTTGWNRIGYIMKGNSKLGEAFDSASLPTGDIVLKSKEASAVYYPASGWAGDLDSLRILTGYMMKTEGNSNLKYLAGSAKLKSAQSTVFNRNLLYNEYKINPASFENSANLIGELVNANNENIICKGDLLLAYEKNESRGVTEAVFVPDLNRYVFVLTMFSDTNQEILNFRLKSLTNNTEEAITEELIFKTDEIFGKPMNPILLHLSNATGINETGTDPTISIYPNPVNEELQIVSQSKIKSVTLSGLSGNSIQLLSNISEYNLKLDTRTLVPGMYMLKVETSKGIVIRKLIKSTNR
jgi:hypothetical protein